VGSELADEGVTGGIGPLTIGWGVIRSTTRPMPAVPMTFTGGDLFGGGGGDLVGLAFGSDVDGAHPARRDRHAHRTGMADEVTDRERSPAFGAAQRSEQEVRHREANEAEPDPDRRRRAAVEVEDLGGEDAADSEHGDEREERRHERDAADREVDVEGVEQAAEDVVEQDGDQEQPTADEGGEDEDEVLDGHGDRRHANPSAAKPRSLASS
jgi:hypothetical protein